MFLMTYSQNSPRIETDALFSWFIVCCGIVGAMNLAKLAPCMGKLIDYFNISLSISGLLGAIFSILMIFTGLITGIFISKYGPRLAMLLGLFISLIGGLAPVFYPVLSVLMIGRIFEGYGFLLINLSAPVLLTLHTNDHNRGRIMGIWGSFMPAGNALIILLAPLIYSISAWWLLWGVSSSFAAIILFFAFFMIPSDPKQFKYKFPHKLSLIVVQTLKKGSVAVIGLTFACHSLIFLGNMQFLSYYFEKILGYAPTFSYLATASYCLISFLGHLFCGFLLNNGYKPKNLLSFAFVTAGLFVAFFFGVFDVFLSSKIDTTLRLGSILLAAFFMGLTPPTIFYLVSYINPPSRITPINYGYMVQFQAIGIFSGSFLYGWLVDLTEGWVIVGFLSILISILGIIGGIISSKFIVSDTNEILKNESYSIR